MRTSTLSRSVMAVASLAIGSVALAAVPANAATASGVTRAQVLTAAAGVRAAPAGTIGIFEGGPGYGSAANRALRAMVNRTCGIDPDGPELSVGLISAATAAGQSAEGVVVSAYVLNTEAGSGPTIGRLCSFGALAPVAQRSVLTGTASVTGGPVVKLSRDAFLTPPVNTPLSSGGPDGSNPTFSANGAAIQTNKVKVKDKKTSKEKKAAKKKYDKRLKAAKKAYSKALDKAGSSKSKKASAKKSWNAAKKSAKTKYKYAIANYKLRTKKTSSPFAVSAQYTPPAP